MLHVYLLFWISKADELPDLQGVKGQIVDRQILDFKLVDRRHWIYLGVPSIGVYLEQKVRILWGG